MVVRSPLLWKKEKRDEDKEKEIGKILFFPFFLHFNIFPWQTGRKFFSNIITNICIVSCVRGEKTK